MFPGLVNLSIIIYACIPGLLRDGWRQLLAMAGRSAHGPHWGWVVVAIYAWLAGSMAVAYAAKVIEPSRFGRLISPLLLFIAGYGSLLCACTFASYVKELRRAEMTWDKTEKTGKVAIPT